MGDNLVNFQDLTSMVMMFNPNPALIISTVFSFPVPNTDIKQTLTTSSYKLKNYKQQTVLSRLFGALVMYFVVLYSFDL